MQDTTAAKNRYYVTNKLYHPLKDIKDTTAIPPIFIASVFYVQTETEM